MKKYKLTDKNFKAHNGFQWKLGKKEVIKNPGTEMCSRQVFHYYASPEQAVLFNPIHANILNPRLFEVEIDEEVAFDGLKGGCHEMTLVRELPLPEISTKQKVTFAIKVALSIYKESNFVSWAENWLSGEDRSSDAADAATDAAYAACADAATDAAYAACAADAAADAADATYYAADATYYAADAAAYAAYATRGATRGAARGAARAARTAAYSTRGAAYAARGAARAARTAVIDFQSIIEEILL